MHRTDALDNIGGAFTDGDPDPLVLLPATVVDAAWLNAVQEEIASVVEADGGALVKGNNSQLLAAIRVLDQAWWLANTIPGTTDITAALQARITAKAASNAPVELPSATMLTTGVTVPGAANQQTSLVGQTGTIIKAAVGATDIVAFSSDVTRTGSKLISSVKIDGNSISGTTGLKIGDTTGAALQVYGLNLELRHCDTGLDMYSSMEDSITDATVYSNIVGCKLRQDVTNGGGNANRFDGLRVQENTIGLVIDRTSIYPMGANQFNNTLFQGNTLTGLAIFGGAGMQFNACHFEGNGTAGTNLTVDGRVIHKCSIQVDDATVSFADCNFSEQTDPLFKLYNKSHVTLTNCSGYGASEGVLFEKSDATESYVDLVGNCDMAGSGGWIKSWAGFTMSTGRGLLWGEPISKVSNAPTNHYFGTGNNPWTPEAQNAAAGVTVSKVYDLAMGCVQAVAHTADAGSTAVNRVTFSAIEQAITVGDFVVVSFLARADADTVMTFYLIGSGALCGPKDVPLSTEWRRVVFYGQASSSSASGYIVYAYPVGTDAPTCYYSQMMAAYEQVGGDPAVLIAVVRDGLFNSQRSTFFAPAIPTSGIFHLYDRVTNVTPTVGQPKAWSCTSGGGASSTTRADNTAYALGVWATWTTGTTVWECTTAGTSAGAAPSIVGKVIGDTVVDGGVTWTMRSMTTATLTSEGNL